MIISYHLAFAQNSGNNQISASNNFWNDDMIALARSNSRQGHVYLPPNSTILPNDIFTTHKAAFNLGTQDIMVLSKTSVVNSNYTLFRYNHYINGAKIEGSSAVIHYINGAINRIVYKLRTGVSANTTPSISEAAALNNALSYLNDSIYLWEDSLYMNAFGISYSEAFPNGELKLKEDNKLVWHFEISSISPNKRKAIEVNAIIGNIEYENSLEETCVPTTYNVSLSATSPSKTTCLLNNTLENDIDKLKVVSFTTGPGYTVVDNSATTTNIKHRNLMWSLQKTYEYFYSIGLDHYDNNPNTEMIVSQFHNNSVPPAGRSGNTVRFAYDMNYATMDVMAHEWTHVIISQYSQLEYKKESGALNESFCDIFGEMAEQFAESNNSLVDYLLGEDIGLVSGNLSIPPERSMINPNLYNHPKVYGDPFWVNTIGCIPSSGVPIPNNDLCGVHTNSGVQNHWFYLLAEGNNVTGGSVVGIGKADASFIAFGNMISLLSNANYRDAAEGSMEVAIQEFGYCSQQVQSTFNAWVEVGVFTAGEYQLFDPYYTYQNAGCGGSSNPGSITALFAGTPPYTYSLNSTTLTTPITGTTSNTEFTFAPLSAGVYNLSFSDLNGPVAPCGGGSTTISISNSPLQISLDNTTNPDCTISGSIDITASGGTPPYTYLWTGTPAIDYSFIDVTLEDISQLKPGVYSIEVTDDAGCVQIMTPITLSSALPQLEVDEIITNNPLTCYNDNNASIELQVLTGTPPFSTIWYKNWTPATTTPFSINTYLIDNLTIGNYQYYMQDANGCATAGDINITEPSEIVINSSIIKEPCNGSLGEIAWTFTGGVPFYNPISGSYFYEYTWEDVINGNTLTETSSTLSNITSGTYRCSVRDAISCLREFEFVLQENIVNTSLINTTPSLCSYSLDGTATINVSGSGNIPYTFLWYDGNGNTRYVQNPSDLSIGNWSVLVTDYKLCNSSLLSVPITGPSEIHFNESVHHYCSPTDEGTIDLTGISGGTPSFTYTLNGTTAIQPFTNLAPDSYIVLATDANLCEKQETIIINDAPQLTINNLISPICDGGSNDGEIEVIVSQGTSPYQYRINGGAFQNMSTFIGLNAGNHFVEVIDANGCIVAQNHILTPSNVLPNGINEINGITLSSSSNQNITYTTPKYFTDNIIVKDGATLNFVSTTAYFDDGVKIIVEPGGTLTTINTLLTAACSSQFWGGILATDLPVSVALVTPSIIIQSNTIIEYADIGIATENLQVAKSFPPKDDMAALSIQGSTFKNCHIAIQYGKSPHGFVSYDNWGTSTASSSVVIQGNTFVCNNILPDASYNGKGTETFIEKYGYYKEDIFNNIFVNNANALSPNQKPNGIIAYGGFSSYKNFNNIKGNTFTNLSKGLVLNNLNTVGGDLTVSSNKNIFNNVGKGIYLLGEADIIGNDFLNITNPVEDFNPYTDDVSYGIFVMGEKPRNIRANVFEGSTVPGTGYLLTAAIVFEETGNALIQCTGNTMSKTKVGIQVEGRNDEVGIFCNTFAADGNAHTTAGLRVVNNYIGTGGSNLYSDGSLRDQGQNCLSHSNPAGNEWLNTTGNTDIVLQPLYSNNTLLPYFKYVYHSLSENSTTATQPKIDPNLKTVWESLTTYELKECLDVNVPNDGYQKLSNSCDGFSTKSLFTDGSGVVNVNPSITDLIGIKANLELAFVTAENNLINPDFQPDLVENIKKIEHQLQEVVMKLYEEYLAANMEVQAKLLLETEDYTEAKKELIEVYYKEEDFVKSRQAQSDLEYLLNNKPDYYYKNIDEKEAFEYNELYYKEINELLMQVRESNRDENQLIYWEKYGLELIKESGLPVAVKAEELLRLNNEEVLEHRVENPIINTVVSASTPYIYNMGIVPNPAMYQTKVLINIPYYASNPTLKLYDGYNNQGLLQTHLLVDGDNIVDIDVSNYISGLYTFTLEVDGVVVSSKHLVVIH